jgi:hypothetical protein
MADTKVSALASASTLDGTELVPVVQGGVSKQTTVAAISAYDIVKVVSTAATSTSTTPAAVSALDASLAPGTYLVKCWMVMRAAATTTGVGIHLKANGGTVTTLVATWYTLTTGTTATSGVMDQASVAATFQTMEGRAQRASDVSGGPFGGVDTANADQFAVLEGVVVVTATTTLQVMLASEVAASQVDLRAGTTLTASKVA